MKALRFENITGRVFAGNKKYKKIKFKNMTWTDISKYVRKRDGKCLKCNSTKNLQADHFHPNCYVWIKEFFNTNKIQTLCKSCHVRMPSMIIRKKKGWKKFCYI